MRSGHPSPPLSILKTKIGREMLEIRRNKMPAETLLSRGGRAIAAVKDDGENAP